MLSSITESLGKILDGLMLFLSGVGGLIIPLVVIGSLIALIRYFFENPVRASRVGLGAAVMIGSVLVPAVLSFVFELRLSEKPLIFLVLTLASYYAGSKIGKWIMGRYGDEES
ncbi:hypothetical protein [Silanimonas sp.]|uniref:hypothetical protein n=1 Tax=Silanimonas sp. TaxID=1929290 RepID=UPI0022C1EA82|nr:hypothetical protein [Silanimonas sp.]MCZ8063930.1 hypothetical protein [Silanimonas sp.]